MISSSSDQSLTNTTGTRSSAASAALTVKLRHYCCCYSFHYHIECVGFRPNSDVLKSFLSLLFECDACSFINSLTLDSFLSAQTLRSRSLTTVTMASTLQCYWLAWVSCFPTTVSSLMWTTYTTSFKVYCN